MEIRARHGHLRRPLLLRKPHQILPDLLDEWPGFTTAYHRPAQSSQHTCKWNIKSEVGVIRRTFNKIIKTGKKPAVNRCDYQY